MSFLVPEIAHNDSEKDKTMDWVTYWLELDYSGKSIPPLVMEITLFDGSKFFVQSVIGKDNDTKTYCVRVWDMRALNQSDMEQLLKNLNEIPFDSHTLPHPKLDIANLFIHDSDVRYYVAWHNRIWPDEIRKQMGFTP